MRGTLKAAQMNLFGKTRLPFLVAPVITPPRIWFAMMAAAAVDGLQLALAWFGWFGADEVLDVIGMLLTSAAIGFHPLLLPTFVVEFIPVVDMLPTWTACTAAVIMLRKRSQAPPPPPPSPPPAGPPPIDISAEVTRVPPKL